MRISTLFTAALVVGLAVVSQAQTLVSTTPADKNAIIEEFTGVRCPNCPDGHNVAAGILANYPDRAHVIAYAPTNSSYTSPVNGGDYDFRRGYLDAFYSSAYCGSRFMPGAFVNRREWGNPAEKMTSRGVWDSHAQTIMAEASPLNVGVSSTYDIGMNTLTVNVEVYYTSTVTDGNSLYVHLMESGIVAEQQGSGGSANYVHKHNFVEHISTGQWGDAITGNTTAGSLYTTQYVFDLNNAVAPININNAEVIAFVIEDNSTEIYTGVVVDADGGSTATAVNELEENMFGVGLFPNPTTGNVSINYQLEHAANVSIAIHNVLGETVYSEGLGVRSNGVNSINLDLEAMNLNSGAYFVQIINGNQTVSKKLIYNK